MAMHDFLRRHRIVRNAIRKDLLFFGIPAILVFFSGLILSARDGYDGLLTTIWDLVRHPEHLDKLSVQNVAGLLLCVAGLTIMFVAVGTLWRFYASTLVIREGHRLITHGIYRFTRHPMYLGAIIVCISVPVYATSLYGLLAMSILIPIGLNRIRLEEKLLTEEFGEVYRRYRKATSKLIPFIY